MAAAKLSEGDSIAMQGEVTRINDDGTVTVRLHGFDYPVTTRPRAPATGAEAEAGPLRAIAAAHGPLGLFQCPRRGPFSTPAACGG